MTKLSHEFQELLESPEGARVEFKAASGSYHFEDLVKYSVALANEGGGTIVLGVSDRRPRQVVGTNASRSPDARRRGCSSTSDIGCASRSTSTKASAW